MLLRRFMKHVSDQNWFAVGLDVIVVIVGIFLGLQVQASYEERKEQVVAAAFVDQLTNDIRIAINDAAAQEALYLRHVDNASIALRYLHDEVTFEDHEKDITRGFNDMTLIAEASVGVGNIERLFASDAPPLTKDNALNDRISVLVKDI